MAKYFIVLLKGDVEPFLKDLQSLGMMDIARGHKPFDIRSATNVSLMQRYKKASKELKKYITADSLPAVGTPYSLLEKAEAKLSELDTLTQDLKDTQTLAKQAAAWGEFDSADLERLGSMNLKPHFYHVKAKKFNKELMNQYPCDIIAEDADSLYIVALETKGQDFSFPFTECDFPEISASDYLDLAEQKESHIADAKSELASLACCIDILDNEYNRVGESLDLYFASKASQSQAQDSLAIFEGFVPIEQKAQADAFLDEAPVVYLCSEANVEDNPPIKLRNNKFAKLFEVLTGMYGMPCYNEFDPTPILGPFFLLFFAMCMGDAGYGMLLIIIGILMGKSKMSLSKLGPIVTVLGIGTFVVGFFLGTFFGISLYEASWMPDYLKSFIFHGKIMGYDAQMVLAIGIGIFHLCLAMIIKGLSYTHAYGFRATVSTWGWCLLIIGGIITAALALPGILPPAITKWVIILLGVFSALGIFVFNKPGRNPLLNVGAGLWDTYNMVTCIMGDVLSYIRLYALGLAGGMLGNAFNDLGMMAFDGLSSVPGLNFLVLALILLMGHALNLAMSCLGAFVHPLRLTFVEYFKNSGYVGKGKKYNPLQEKKQ